MNLLGKIFTLLIFLASVVFMFMALVIGASHKNWREMAMKNKAVAENQANLRREIVADTKKASIELQSEKVARAFQIAQLNAQLISAKNEQLSKEASLKTAEETLAEQSNQITTAQKRVEARDREIEGLRTANSKLIDEIADVRKKVVEITNQIYQLKGTVQTLEERRNQLASTNAKLTKVLKSYGLKETSLTDFRPPDVAGSVTAASGDRFLVSIGNDDGIRIGHRISIYRRDKYVGSAKIVKVDHNYSVALMDNDLKQVPVQEGDYVRTEL